MCTTVLAVFFVWFVSQVGLSADAQLYEYSLVFENPNDGPSVGEFGDTFGSAIAVVGDRVLIGAYRDDNGGQNAGSAYLFDRHGKLLHTIANPTPQPEDLFGWHVGGVRDELFVSAILDTDSNTSLDAGTLYLFDNSGVFQRAVPNPSPLSDERFGDAIAATESLIVVTDLNDSSAAIFGGAAYIFDEAFNLKHKIISPDPDSNELFGHSAAVSDEYILIGGYDNVDEMLRVGAAHLFTHSGEFVRTFANPTPSDDDRMGFSVDMHGDRVLVGSYHDLDEATGLRSGAAYLFDLQTGELLQTFRNPTPENEEWFGRSVKLIDDTFLITASRANDVGIWGGAGYLFDLQGNLLQTLFAPTLADGARLGEATALLGDKILISAHFEGDGRVYMFSPVPEASTMEGCILAAIIACIVQLTPKMACCIASLAPNQQATNPIYNGSPFKKSSPVLKP